MSALTREFHLKTGENSIKYTVVVSNFRQKIVLFKAGKYIRSKNFQVGRSTFCLCIKPSGDEGGSTDVAVYLQNMSDWDVIADVKFEVGNCKKKLSKKLFNKNDDPWGFRDLVPHARCHNGDLLVDGNFHLEVFIDLDGENVLPHHDVEEAISKMKSHVDQKFGAMKKMIENKFTKMDQRLATIEAGGASSSSSSSRDLECPVCAETVRPPMRLKQCGQGHIICDDCHRQRISHNATTGRECHTCKGPITGRPNALERILGLI